MTSDPSKINRNSQELREQITELQRHQEEAIEFQQKLEILQTISIELDRTHSFDALCRLGVEAGLKNFDVDRMSFWFVDEKREFLTGTFGVDEEGFIRDERHQRKRFEDELLRSLSLGQIDEYRDENAPLYNDKDEVVGHGWIVVVPLLDGNDIVGYLACDNLINQRPLKSYQPKLLQLYGATIGYMARSKQEASRRQMFQYAIEQSQGSIILFNLLGEIMYRNSSMLNLFDNNDFQHVDQIIDFLMTNDPEGALETVEIDWNNLYPGAQLYHDWKLKAANGDDVFLEMRISTITENDNIVQYFMRFDDVTIRREVEQQKLELQLEHERAELLQTFVTHTAHEFRTPLSIINTKAYLLSQYTDNEKAIAHTETIRHQSKSIQSLLDDMLEMVRLQNQTALENVSINLSDHLLMCVTQAQQSDSGQANNWILDVTSNLFVICDEIWLSKALNNILENALVYSDDGTDIVVRASDAGNTIHISIQDHGIGVPQDKLLRIFEPLYRVDEARTDRGTGLGLAIARQVIERCGGKIYATSKLDVGTTVHITLPSSKSSQ